MNRWLIVIAIAMFLLNMDFALLKWKVQGRPATVPSADAAVRFKLMMYDEGIFFGAREEWADDLGISLATIGSESRAPSPSKVEFRGEFIHNDAPGKRKIDAIIALFP